MLMIQKCYPYGKHKAFNVTYDDGVEQDVRLVALLHQYGIKGTFNLNYGLMETEFEWVHENGMTVKRLSRQAVTDLYDGHEVASHTLTHPYMSSLSHEEIRHEMASDKHALETLFGREVAGFAVPFHYFSDEIAHCAAKCGFRYARMSEFTGSYTPWQDPFHWKCGFYHILPGLQEYVDRFLQTKEELALCQIVGHSYDLDALSLWEATEDIFRKVSMCADIWLATNLEIVMYLQAMEKLAITEEAVINNSQDDLWFEIDGEVKVIHAGETMRR